ncbi:MAG: TetR/AcrR family transcriptional regulator [Novosphingobium sp.]|nr:TetR/AcrR family transcriptional regulator [Novosphingobium sp.]
MPAASPQKMPPHQKRQPQKRGSKAKLQAILDAAAAVLSRKGYIEASLAEIAEIAGTKAGSLYYYFESKDALIEVVLIEGTRRMMDQIEERYLSLNPEAPVFDRICSTIRQHVVSTAEQDDYARAYARVFENLPEDMRNRITNAGAQSYARLWKRLLAEGVECGLIRRDFDLRILRLILTGGIVWMGKWYKPDGPNSPDEIADTIIRLFFEGAGTPLARQHMAERLS